MHRDMTSQGLMPGSSLDDIIGESPEIKNIKQTAEKLAKTSLAILIQGESGTGKSLLAKVLHQMSGRSDRPFVAVSFTALTQQQIESRLFGRGVKAVGGLLRKASGGTLFLEGIENLPLETQARLVQVIQDEEGTDDADLFSSLNVRIISSCSADPNQMIADCSFRTDLLYRLKEGYLHLPPLKERVKDIPLLAEHWQQNLSPAYKPIDPQALDVLMHHDWPGNIRELFNVMKFASAVNERQIITTSDLPYDILNTSRPKAVRTSLLQTDKSFLIILSAIHEINSKDGIAGRSRIYWYLKDNGHEISEYKIRKTVPQLIRQGLVAAKQGKYGLSLTDKGIMVLETQYY